ncbi:MAG: hypothetical protein RLZZ290_898 [Pseudomonadota bacterium]|jgi:iron(III) transport system substrate-binding protein
MNTLRRLTLTTALALSMIGPTTSVHANERVLNLYTARHYSSDDALYAAFTKQTGIKVNVVSAGDEPLLERLRSEGKASPADVLLLADASRLERAAQEGLFAPVQSKLLEQAIPASLRNQNLWFGLTTRARVIVVDPLRIKPDQVKTYADLAKPEFKGMICSRTAAHPYMLSLIGSQIAHLGPERAKAWAQGVKNNLARPPKGGDTDQIKAVASGECTIAITNTYYYARLMRSNKPEDRAMVSKTRLVWPDQAGVGTHVNISGGGLLRTAPNKTHGQTFLEFLASPEAQAQFAEANNEWPARAGVKVNNPELESLGAFKADPMPVSQYASKVRAAQELVDQVGWR